ncbi:hypothetical protein ACOSQ2_022684 [Xanthoceras sorbifolium]
MLNALQSTLPCLATAYQSSPPVSRFIVFQSSSLVAAPRFIVFQSSSLAATPRHLCCSPQIHRLPRRPPHLANSVAADFVTGQCTSHLTAHLVGDFLIDLFEVPIDD